MYMVMTNVPPGTTHAAFWQEQKNGGFALVKVPLEDRLVRISAPGGRTVLVKQQVAKVPPSLKEARWC
jgi:hypothetical protein